MAFPATKGLLRDQDWFLFSRYQEFKNDKFGQEFLIVLHLQDIPDFFNKKDYRRLEKYHTEVHQPSRDIKSGIGANMTEYRVNFINEIGPYIQIILVKVKSRYGGCCHFYRFFIIPNELISVDFHIDLPKVIYRHILFHAQDNVSDIFTNIRGWVPISLKYFIGFKFFSQ